MRPSQSNWHYEHLHCKSISGFLIDHAASTQIAIRSGDMRSDVRYRCIQRSVLTQHRKNDVSLAGERH